MISEARLKEICDIYKIDYDKLVDTNENILKYGEYDNICYALDFLRDEVNIEPRNIEKCPSILYRNVENIKINYEFLKKEQITKYNVDGCLHILSTEPSELKRTYQYIMNNYGIRYLNARTTILRVPVDRIKEIERKFPEFKKKNVLQAACSRRTIEEIEKIVKVCKENRIKPTGTVFLKTAEEIEKIVKVCKENGIEPTGSVFMKTAKQLQENINYISENYGEEYLNSLIITKNIKNLKVVLPYLQEKGILKILPQSASILSLTLDEIKEREKFIKGIGEGMLNTKGNKFNSIFGLSKKRYAQRVEKEKNKGVEL